MCIGYRMDEEFRRLVDTTARNKDSVYYYTAELETHLVEASAANRSVTVELTIQDTDIGPAGVLDEGLVSTIADFWTSALITAVNGGRGALTTTLNVQALKPVSPGTKIHVICSATAPDSRPMPFATARFVSAADYDDVLAVATHTKFFKAAT
ncbi:hypothetical protein BX667DRAFT_494522 [Coemansia mojavensis]|nr:hypothetical protein BX667DRAFT_494522 [Coemansia mojavensis]